MAHLYHATVAWRLPPGADFARGRYSRGHVWRFDGGTEVEASASPQVVPAAYAPAGAVDPEEAFVASLSSCHMLTFLDLARRDGFVVEAYEDSAEGRMEKSAQGRLWVSLITLKPRIDFSGEKRPGPGDLARLHDAAHDLCFIANSIKTEIRVEPTPA